MSLRGLRLIINGEGWQSHGWSAGSLRTLHLAVPAGKPTGQEPFSIRSRPRFRWRT